MAVHGSCLLALLLALNGVSALRTSTLGAVGPARMRPRINMAVEAAPVPSKQAEPPPPVHESLLKMARLNAVPMAAGLVGAGAYGARRTIATGSGLGVAASLQLVLCMVLTIIVTTGSMLINDYYDFMRGVDTIETKPDRPLVRGDIAPHMVKRALKWMYAAHLTLICFVDAVPLRLWVLGSTLLTYVYSVHLKPRTGLKNIVCAMIVAMALGLGGMAVGGMRLGLAAVWRPMVIMFCGIWHRELVMDIKDMPGDAITGVATLPVLLGRDGALVVSLLPLFFAALTTLSAGSLSAAAPIAAMLVLAVNTKRSGFKRGPLKMAIESAPAWLAWSLVALMR